MLLTQVVLVAILTLQTAWAIDVRPFLRNRAEDKYKQQCPSEPVKCSECGGENPGWKKHCTDLPHRTGNQVEKRVYCECVPDSQATETPTVVPPVFAFPSPPPGYVDPPEGVPEPEKGSCPSNPYLLDCSDCDGKSGWCSSTENAGCPCQEKCPAHDKKLKCSSDNCKGDGKADEKCTTGAYKKCECEKECPTDDDTPICNDDDDEDNDCKGKNGKCTAGKYKGCACKKGCPKNEDAPICGDDSNDCKDKDGACTAGEHKGCKCRECPSLVEAPFCKSDTCKREVPEDSEDGHLKCTNGESKGCPCPMLVDATYDTMDLTLLASQQHVLDTLKDLNDEKSNKPLCIHGVSHKYKPEKYCQCGDNYATTYAVAKSTTSPYNPCPYTSLPKSTLDFTTVPPPTPTEKPTTSSSSSSTASKTTPTLGPISTYSSHSCYGKDIHSDKVRNAADDFCDKNGDTVIKKGGDVLKTNTPAGYYQTVADNTAGPTWYYITVGWNDDCDINMEPKKLGDLIPDMTCSDLIYRAWDDANGNEGRGGHRSVGCVDISYKPRCWSDPKS